MTMSIFQIIGLCVSFFSLGVSIAGLFHYGGRRK